MLADFIITIEDARKPLAVRVKVHESIPALRSAITQYDRHQERLSGARNRRVGPSAAEQGILGVCHRFHWDKDPVCALVRLAPPYTGAGIVAHELSHAALWIHDIEQKFQAVPISSTEEIEERFCWILGELVRQTTNAFFDKGVYKYGE